MAIPPICYWHIARHSQCADPSECAAGPAAGSGASRTCPLPLRRGGDPSDTSWELRASSGLRRTPGVGRVKRRCPPQAWCRSRRRRATGSSVPRRCGGVQPLQCASSGRLGSQLPQPSLPCATDATCGVCDPWLMTRRLRLQRASVTARIARRAALRLAGRSREGAGREWGDGAGGWGRGHAAIREMVSCMLSCYSRSMNGWP